MCTLRSMGHAEKFSRWLVETGARKDSIATLVDAFCRFQNAEGRRIRRLNLIGQTLHPSINHFRYLWFDEIADPGPFPPHAVVSRQQTRLGRAMVDELKFIGDPKGPNYLNSPLATIDREGELYARIAPVGEPQDFPIFEELATLGCTAYFGIRLDGFSNMSKRVTLATNRPDGFGEEERESLRTDLRILGLVLRAFVERDIKHTLASVYLGQDAGERVCGGMIKPGDVLSIGAAIWFSELRGFTARSCDVVHEDLLKELNAYFECIAGAITANGGQVLKYVGDAILAVFAIEEHGTVHEACQAALGALADKEEALAALNADREAVGAPAFKDGVALHVGTVGYGNIGTRDRLDFTVIGHEVNVAARLESLCKELDEPVLCSRAFSDVVDLAMRPLGAFDVRGVAHPLEAFAPGAQCSSSA